MKFKTNLKLLQFFLIAAALLPNMAWAQINADDLEVINLEDLYKKEEVKLPQQQIAPPVTAAETTEAEATTAEVKSE